MTAHDLLLFDDEHAPEHDIAAAREFAERYLQAEHGSQERASMATALTVLLDDPSRAIRKAISKTLASRAYAPAHVVRSLASDIDEVAIPVLRESPILTDAELVDLLAQGSEAVQCAIAARSGLPASISAAICEVASERACQVLLDNASAEVLQSSLLRLAQRFENRPDICDQLLRTRDLPLANRYELLMRLAESLDDHPIVLERVPENQRHTFLSDAEDKVVLRLALEASEEELPDFVEHLARCRCRDFACCVSPFGAQRFRRSCARPVCRSGLTRHSCWPSTLRVRPRLISRMIWLSMKPGC